MIFQGNRKAKYSIDETDNKNPFLCQVKNKDFLLIPWTPPLYFFFFGFAFFVAFFALGCFIPHDISWPPPLSFYSIDLFIPFKLIFVKSFLVLLIVHICIRMFLSIRF
jgi:hypothetical protein